MSVIIETTLGDITVDLHVKERPRACINFLKLCKIKYYNYCIFFNIQRDFIAQTGDPTGSGKGGESVFSRVYGDQASYFEPEMAPQMKHSKVGTLSMANNGSNMHGSQFFLTLAENLDYLDGIHTVFGEVSEGFDVLQKINEAIVDDTNRPFQDIRINHTVIVDDPFPDPSGLLIPSRSPSPTFQQLQSSRIAPEETIEEHSGKSREEVEEIIKDKEAKARAQILEMVGDLPDADVKPPDNVLFVCKLNAVTSDDDLLIIFSRFGPIQSCEVIRDQKSGDSLQYAFIEFEKEEDCASAYFKMDNVLIDDRRIHVDFSQSVAKLDWVNKRQRQPSSATAGSRRGMQKPVSQEQRNTVKSALVSPSGRHPDHHHCQQGQKGINHRERSPDPRDRRNYSPRRQDRHYRHSPSRHEIRDERRPADALQDEHRRRKSSPSCSRSKKRRSSSSSSDCRKHRERQKSRDRVQEGRKHSSSRKDQR